MDKLYYFDILLSTHKEWSKKNRWYFLNYNTTPSDKYYQPPIRRKQSLHLFQLFWDTSRIIKFEGKN